MSFFLINLNDVKIRHKCVWGAGACILFWRNRTVFFYTLID